MSFLAGLVAGLAMGGVVSGMLAGASDPTEAARYRPGTGSMTRLPSGATREPAVASLDERSRRSRDRIPA